jgi:hypothetical protein
VEIVFRNWHEELIEPSLEQVHLLLVNWGNWSRSRLIYRHCGSVEHRWKPHRGADADWEGPPRLAPRPEPLEFDALAVERTMRHLSKPFRKALKLCYIVQIPPDLVCQRLHLRAYQLSEHMRKARFSVRNLLTRANYVPQNASNSRSTPSSLDEKTILSGVAFTSEMVKS